MKYLLFAAGFLLLLATEILRVYYIMPFPGSQQSDTIDVAYFIQSNLGLIRLLGILIIAWPMYHFAKTGSRSTRIITGLLLLFYVGVFYLFNFRFLAEKMFIQPRHKVMMGVGESKIPGHQLIVGVTINGDSRAYPIEIIGYHHQVRDTVGGEPIMVTYCTVCRTGRVYRPMVAGTPETFRLVGMDHFNAMFEDSRTRSWWRQVNGEAIAGQLKGEHLPEIPSQQLKLSAWIALHPNTLILQEDPSFKKVYENMRDYDEGKEKSELTGTDSVSWGRKSWVVGVVLGNDAKAYDWLDLKRMHTINDRVGDTPVVIALESDTASFHVWKRVVGMDTLELTYIDSLNEWSDMKTQSVWDGGGACVGGKLKGSSLQAVQSYQEYWHSWSTFHPQTQQFKP